MRDLDFIYNFTFLFCLFFVVNYPSVFIFFCVLSPPPLMSSCQNVHTLWILYVLILLFIPWKKLCAYTSIHQPLPRLRSSVSRRVYAGSYGTDIYGWRNQSSERFLLWEGRPSTHISEYKVLSSSSALWTTLGRHAGPRPKEKESPGIEILLH